MNPLIPGPSMQSGVIKICGLREPAHAVAATRAGADLIGFIFAPARRRVTPAHAAICIREARAAATRPVRAVGVFVNESVETMNAVAEEADLDLLQLHGEEEPRLLAQLRRPVLKAIRPRHGESAEVVGTMMQGFATAQNAPVAFLIDGFDPIHHGGGGIRADWTLAQMAAERHPLLLAGGLDQENVAEAIQTVGPFGVDVSSGVETNGVKDIVKIKEFVEEARRQFLGRRLAAASR